MMKRIAVLVALGSAALWGQAPQIDSLNPTSQLPGVTFTLQITGQRFCFNSRVIFGGEIDLTASVQSTTTILAQVPGGLTEGLSGDVPVQVVNPVGNSGCSNSGTQSNIVPIRIGAPALTITTNSLVDAVLGINYSQFLQVTGGGQPYTFSISAGSLPAGMSLNAQTGLLSGAPTQSGAFTFTVRVVDGFQQNATRQLTLNVRGALDITTTSLPAGNVGTAYTATLGAVGGTSPYSWALLGGAPTGITLSSAGVLSGTPTQAGTFNLQVRVSDAVNAQVTRTLALQVNGQGLQIQTTSLPAATAGVAYTTNIVATGGVQPYVFSTTSALPTGMTLTSAGVLSGVTGQGGTFTINVSVRDSLNNTATRTLTLTVSSTLQITTASLPQAALSQGYSTTITATGGAPPYVWSAPGGLPAGFTLDPSSGILSGTPLQEGVFTFNVQVQDSLNQTNLRALQLVVGSLINITTAAVRNGLVGQPYEDFFTATGGIAPYTWSLLSPNPPGLSLNFTTGSLSGVPSLPGIFNLTVRVTDTRGASATRSYSVTVLPQFSILTQTLPAATLGLFYEQTLVANGGTAPYFWSIPGGAPAGLVLNQFTGVLSGVPTQGGVFNLLVQATDSTGQQTSKQLSLTVNQTISVGPATIPNGAVGTPYSQTFVATGGLAPFVYVISVNPPGLTLNGATGVLSGTPTQTGVFEFSIRASDSVGQLGLRSYTLTVVAGLEITTTSLREGIERTAYTQALTATGGVPPYTWRVASGPLPDGLQLNASTGVISGTPFVASSTALTIEVSDATGGRLTRTFTLNILAGVSVQSGGTLPNGTVGTAYSFNLAARGGTTPYRWRIREGLLPDGLQLTPESGMISGTPTRAGRFPANVEVTDAGGLTANGDIIINVNAPLLRITSGAVLLGATAGVNYQFTAAATGGTPPYRWSLNGAPAGLTMNEATGAITGRVATPGSFEFTIRVSDSLQVVSNQSVTLAVSLPAAPTVNITGLPATGGAGQQVSPRVNIAQAYPVALTGELILTFNSAVGVDDPAIQFSTGGRRVAFNIAAGQTDAAFNAASLGIQTGTVAGTIVVTARISAAGTDVTPAPAPSSSIVIARAAPVINSVRVNRTANGFELVIVGYATPREITTANVRLTTSGTVQGTEFTVNLGGATGPWYQGTNSQQFGSLCAITIPFTIQQGTTGQVTSVSVTLTNALGTSVGVSANF
ncbi:MAG: putative Ig domain-containing protein [Bryobacterales bacterium]|nr:putative Ig domain-containing protein [Bryobacterales bacterium]